MPCRCGSCQCSLIAALAGILVIPCSALVAAAGPETRPSSHAPDRSGDDRKAARDAVDRSQLVGDLLGARPATTGERVQQLMDDSARRLAEQQDPGLGTQYVQEQIIAELDKLILQEQNRRRPAPTTKRLPETRPARPPVPEPGDPGFGRPKPGHAVTSRPGRQSGGANGMTPGGGDAPPATGVGDDFRQKAEAWGKVSPRLVGPMIDGRSERVSEKYRGLVDDYYRAVAIKATE